MNCYCPPHSFTDYAYEIANQTRARPKFLSTLRKSGPSPTENLGQVSLGRAQVFRVHTTMGQAQVFENLGRAWASLCCVDTAIVAEICFVTVLCWLQFQRPAISPADFYNALRPFWYKPGTQQDLAEFLERFINILEFEDVKRCTRHGPGIPKVSELFKGQFTVDVQCMNCSAISRRLETFAVVTLALPNTVSNLGRGRDVQIEGEIFIY